MSNYSIYFSPTGGTKKVAGLLTHALQGSWQEIDLSREVMPTSLDPRDLCLISVPSYGGRVPGIAIERLKAITANGAAAVLVCVYGNRAWEDTLTELQDTLEDCGFVCAAAVAAVAEHSIFRQFAAGRPDREDAAELEEFAERIRETLDAGISGTLELAGDHGSYKEYKGVPFKPQGNENCSGCGACAAFCPVGAIDLQESWKTDTEKCISCMRCVSVCRRHARDLDPAVMAERAVQMAPRLGGRKKNYLFLAGENHVLRPRVICHMTVSLDGKVTGNFLSRTECVPATDLYYRIHREYGADAFACGRITMEGSFTGGWYPELEQYEPVLSDADYLPQQPEGFFAVAFDPHGRLGWKENRIVDADEDPGYDKARIIEVLTHQADRRYLGYLQKLGIPYLFAGETELDVETALRKLKACFGIRTLLLEGGSILDGAFQRAGVVDELSLIMAPVAADAGDKPLFMDGTLETYRLADVQNHEDILQLRYRRTAWH